MTTRRMLPALLAALIGSGSLGAAPSRERSNAQRYPLGVPDSSEKYEEAVNQHGASFKRAINPRRREKNASGLSGRQWVKHRKAAQRAARAESIA